MYCMTVYNNNKWFYIVLQYIPCTHMGMYYILQHGVGSHAHGLSDATHHHCERAQED